MNFLTNTFKPPDTSTCLFVLLLLLCHNQEDFMVYFDGVDILDREVNIKDVVLTIDEADGCLAPAKGCARGFFRYWCCCEGAAHLELRRHGGSQEVHLLLIRHTRSQRCTNGAASF